MVCIVKRRAILVFPPGRPSPPRKSFAFPRCLAFARSSSRNKETLASRLAYGSADPSRPPRKSSAFPRCLAFAKLDTRNKEALTSKLVYGSADPSRHLEKAPLFLGVWLSPNWTLAIRRRLQASLSMVPLTRPGTSKKLRFSSVFGFRQIGHSQ